MTDPPETALVTGASSGIGYELAKLFAADGADAILVSRRKRRLEAVAHELDATYGAETHLFTADLSEPAAAVAAAGYRGLLAGDRIVIPGRLNELRTFFADSSHGGCSCGSARSR